MPFCVIFNKHVCAVYISFGAYNYSDPMPLEGGCPAALPAQKSILNKSKNTGLYYCACVYSSANLTTSEQS